MTIFMQINKNMPFTYTFIVIITAYPGLILAFAVTSNAMHTAFFIHFFVVECSSLVSYINQLIVLQKIHLFYLNTQLKQISILGYMHYKYIIAV